MTKREEQAEAIYKAYPLRVGGARAKKAICSALKRASYGELMKAAEDLAKLVEPYKGDDEKMQYVPHPKTFFGPQNRWEPASMAALRRSFPPPKRFYYGTVTPRPGCYARYPSDAVDEWIEAGKSPEEAKKLAVRVYR